jgi:hypothetical protein
VKYHSIILNLHQYNLRIKSNENIKTNCLFLFLVISTVGNARYEQGSVIWKKADLIKLKCSSKNILKDYPQNKTARLCYARAIGLNEQ